MKTENLSTLKIHKLTQTQYDRERAAGNLDETALYLTPDEEVAPDITLSVEGRAADAKAVGDALNTKLTIPEIIADDEGKVLMVVDGKLQLVALSLSVDENGVVSV